MSTAGIYNAWPAIIHGTEDYLKNQMKSHQPPHYFGGSQVPVNLHSHHISGNGIMSTIAKDVGKQLIRKHILGEGFFSNATDDEYKSPPSKYHTNYETRGSMIEPKTGGRYTSYEAGQGQGIGRIRPMGTGMMEEGGSFMGALGMGINDPHTYRKHSTGLCKSIGSNTYRTTKV